MALFGSKKTEEVKASTIRPTVIRTQNISKEIARVAQTNGVKMETLDFTIMSIQSYTRLNTQEKESEWELVDNEALATIDESRLLDKYFEIKQTYEVEIFSKHSRQDRCSSLKTTIGANATKCKIYLGLLEGSHVEYFPQFRSEFEDLIRKKKVRAGILVYIFDDVVADFISKISARLKVDGKIEITKKETQLVAVGFEPTSTIHDALILHYKKKEKVDENSRVDYASRGFIQSVKKDEVLIEYIKPKKGKAGRNCRGEFLEPEEPIIKNEPTFGVDDTIKVVESEDSIRYIAKDNGYIAMEDNRYTIKKEVDVNEVSFKTTGSIRSGRDSDVNLNVTEKDAIKDAVGSGMVVEVSEIDVDGNVGSNAKVIANKVKVGGQTHKTAYIEADEIDINVHKGEAKGKDIHITRLEHGVVEGDDISISQALGGTIKGESIHIDVCASHVKAIASNLIEIVKLHGSENSFIIDPLLQDEIEESVEENEQKMKKLEEDIQVLHDAIKKQTLMVKEGMPAFLDIKKRLLHYKQKGVKMPKTFVQKYQKFQDMQEHLIHLKSEVKIKEEQLLLLKKKTSSFQEDILNARIINRDRWIGYNEIKFRLIDPPTELVFKPAEGSIDKVFGVVEVDEGEYMISPIKE